MKRRLLQFEIKIKPLSPVHIGIGGEKLPRKTYHLYNVETAGKKETRLALLSVRPVASRLLDHFGETSNAVSQLEDVMTRDRYPAAVARDIENGSLARRRMKVHTGASSLIEKEFKPLISLASGLPYIPGSSVKGALRTVWLDWQVSQKSRYAHFKRELLGTKMRGKNAADRLIERTQVADNLQGVGAKPIAQNRDLFRVVSVSDLMPDHDQWTSRIYSVLAMSYGSTTHARPANEGKAGAEAWECLDSAAGATYTGTITIDLDLLEMMITTDADAKNLQRALSSAEAWQEALAKFGERFYETELGHYEMLTQLPKVRDGIALWDDKNLVLDWIEKQETVAQSIFPLGMGVGLMAHSVLASGDEHGFLGDEMGEGQTLLKSVLDTGIRRDARAYQDPDYPTPKSRRVVGNFPGKIASNMKASRPLGWTSITLTQKE